MTQKFRKGDSGELKSKKRFPGEHEHVPVPFLEGCTSGARLGNRSFVRIAYQSVLSIALAVALK